MSQKVINSSSLALCQLCNKHTNILTDPESGEVICTNCGSIINDRTPESQIQWTTSTVEERNSKSRTGAPISLAKHDRGLSTIIGKTNRDASGQQIDTAMRNRIVRWRAWDVRSQAHSTDRNFHTAFAQLDMMKSTLGFPESVTEKIAYLYRKIQDRGMVKGRTIKGVLAVASYIACRELEIPRTIKEIANITNVREKEISRIYRKVMVELDLKIPQVDLMRIIVKIANKCNISEKAKRHAMKIMNEIMKTGISVGKHPMGIAGAVIYMACKNYQEGVTQGQIAEVAGVTEVTIRHNLNSILKMKMIKELV
ncbi:MAG TPA: TFIIB-type zinc ribbon-containing protein [Candidatus Nitrosocosmicus sp.]|nr:TFIIB-type zinc ribbon-containing protein [Candidatus Nitrosocosmicus sp.]